MGSHMVDQAYVLFGKPEWVDKNIFDVLKNGAELAVKPEEATEVLKILEACLESNRKRKAIAL